VSHTGGTHGVGCDRQKCEPLTLNQPALQRASACSCATRAVRPPPRVRDVHRRTAMGKTMPSAQKEVEEAALRVMREKLHFLKNPRYAVEATTTYNRAFGRTMPIGVNERRVRAPATGAAAAPAARMRRCAAQVAPPAASWRRARPRSRRSTL
jgi:hypothetical protein